NEIHIFAHLMNIEINFIHSSQYVITSTIANNFDIDKAQTTKGIGKMQFEIFIFWYSGIKILHAT
ncbi:hypothetical protein ACJX0J_018688, partial [Zea mays]